MMVSGRASSVGPVLRGNLKGSPGARGRGLVKGTLQNLIAELVSQKSWEKVIPRHRKEKKGSHQNPNVLLSEEINRRYGEPIPVEGEYISKCFTGKKIFKVF